jgi:hypothetical protein
MKYLLNSSETPFEEILAPNTHGLLIVCPIKSRVLGNFMKEDAR